MKEKLLLHSCCGPCSTIVIESLIDKYDVTVFYYNPNIEPIEEYNLRKKEQVKFIELLNKDVKIIFGEYENEVYHQSIIEYESLKEGSKRCYECYKLRLEETAKKAYELGFDYFDTTLSVSPYKISKWILELGEELYIKYNVKYLGGNYKKNDGYKKSIELAKKYGLYRQEYCGCYISSIKLVNK